MQFMFSDDGFANGHNPLTAERAERLRQKNLSTPIKESVIVAPKASASYDVFISHASEDKTKVVRPLVKALQKGGMRVWYDELELRIGDSLRKRIDRGISESRFGIIVLSQPFFNKGWTNYELDGLVTRSISGGQSLLPIWHGINENDLIKYSPSLATMVGRSTSNHTIEQIAKEIIEVIKSK